jgi:hypothetical protein
VDQLEATDEDDESDKHDEEDEDNDEADGVASNEDGETRTELVQLQNLFAIVSLQTTMRVSPCCLLFYSSPKIPWLMLLVSIILQLQATSS